jgi:hypothetical protein
MKKIKSFLRLLGLTALIILAMCGVGFFGALFNNNRERMDKAVTAERKDEEAHETDDRVSQE